MKRLLTLFATLCACISLAKVNGKATITAALPSGTVTQAMLDANPNAAIKIQPDAVAFTALTFTIQDSNLTIGPKVYFVPNGQSAVIFLWPDALIYAQGVDTPGPTANSSSGSYLVTLPYGTYYIAEPNGGSSGPTVISFQTWPSQQFGPPASGGKLLMAPQASASGGATPWCNLGLPVTTPVDIKAAMGTISKSSYINLSTTVTYIAVYFNVPAASVTLGTTAPVWETPVPPGGSMDAWPIPLQFTSAVSVAIVTTPLLASMAAAPTNTCWISVASK